MRIGGTASLVWLTAGLAAASIIAAAAPLPRLFSGEPRVPTVTAPSPPGPASSQVSIDPILELSPFGRVIRAAIGPPEVQETSLGLLLHGVVIAVPPENSTALISSVGEPAKVVGIGEEITAGVLLGAVHVDRIELLVDGMSETLSFPGPRQPVADRTAPGEGDFETLRALIAGAAAEYRATPEPASSETAPMTDDAPQAIADRIARYRGALRENPLMLLDELGLSAVEDGYVVNVRASDALRSIGLLPGDVVSIVNGQQVGNVARDTEYFDEVIASGTATIEVVRQEERVVITLPLR